MPNDLIGNYLLYRPLLQLLAQQVHERGQHLTLAANALWAPLTRALGADLFEELLVVDFGQFQKDLGYRAAVLRTIGAGGYGEVIYPLHVREPAIKNSSGFCRPQAGWLARASIAPMLGFAYSTKDIPQRYPRRRPPYLSTTATASFRQLTGQAGVPCAGGTAPPLHLSISAADAARFQPPSAQPAIVLFSGASVYHKQWPAAHFAELAVSLHQYYGEQYRLVLAGSPANDVMARRIQQAAAGVPLDNLCGQTSLPELAALLSQARLLISNDTMAAHLAAQFGTPCIVMLMGENYGKFFPYPPICIVRSALPLPVSTHYGGSLRGRQF